MGLGSPGLSEAVSKSLCEGSREGRSVVVEVVGCVLEGRGAGD